MSAVVLLINPKTPFNVGTSIRSTSIFGGAGCYWTGDRMWLRIDGRLPREERMKDYSNVDFRRDDNALSVHISAGFTPVAIEVTDKSEPLTTFVHPDRAIYVFGPEDGSLSGAILACCHRFVRIPTKTRTPLNLAQTVNLVLYDRFVKSGEQEYFGG